MILHRAKSSFLICVFQIILIAVLVSGCVPGLVVTPQAQPETQTPTDTLNSNPYPHDNTYTNRYAPSPGRIHF